MRCLILGGGGFIGYHLTERLLEFMSVRIFDSNLSRYIDFERKHKLELITGDFMTCDFDELLEGVDIVWHLISTSIAIEGTTLLYNEFTQNVLPTIKLLDKMVEKKTMKIFFLSSGGTIYGNNDVYLKENMPLNPICSYGIQKMTIEKILFLYQNYYNIKAFSIRLSNPYGTKQDPNKRQGVIPIFLNRIKEGYPIEIWGDGASVRDYIHINDAVDAFFHLMEYNGRYSTFNVASGEYHSLNEVVNLIASELKIQPQIIYKEKRQCDVPVNRLDTSLVFQECHWKAKIKLSDGIKMLLHQV